MDLGGGEITRAVERHQVTACPNRRNVPAPLPCCKRRKISNVRRPGHGIEDGPHLGVAGDAIDAEDGAEVVVWVLLAAVEGQQGGVFERKHRKRRHQDVGQGEFNLAGPRVGNRVRKSRRSPKRVSDGWLLPSRRQTSWATPFAASKRGKPGNHSATWLYEREGETELQIPRKMSGRESLGFAETTLSAPPFARGGKGSPDQKVSVFAPAAALPRPLGADRTCNAWG